MENQEFKVNINHKSEHRIVFGEDKNIQVDGKDSSIDIISEKQGVFHVIRDNRSYLVEHVKTEEDGKSIVLKVNGNKYSVQVQDKYDELLHKLGLDNLASHKVNEIKAPMPGLVLNIIVEEGISVKKGDPLLILEAMKMEHILKSPTDGTVKKISVKKGTAVEKNQVLISFS